MEKLARFLTVCETSPSSRPACSLCALIGTKPCQPQVVLLLAMLCLRVNSLSIFSNQEAVWKQLQIKFSLCLS